MEPEIKVLLVSLTLLTKNKLSLLKEKL